MIQDQRIPEVDERHENSDGLEVHAAGPNDKLKVEPINLRKVSGADENGGVARNG